MFEALSDAIWWIGGLPWWGQVLAIVITIATLLAIAVFGKAIALWFEARVEPQLAPTEAEELPDEMQQLAKEYEALGYRQGQPTRQLNTRPPILIVPMIHDSGRMFGAIYLIPIYRIDPVSHEITSLLDPDGELTTTGDEGAAGLSERPGELIQVIPKARPAELHEAHERMLAHLERGDTKVRNHPERVFDELLLESVRARRRHLRSRPVQSAARLVLVGEIFRRSPSLEELRRQSERQRAD